METCLLVGINAKFIHSNLAIRSIATYVHARLGEQSNLKLREFSINQEIDYILSEIMETQPKQIGFSCYLWNIDFVRQLSRSLKLLLPECHIIYGGPEVTYTAIEELASNQYVDYILTGEGEESFSQLYAFLNLNQTFPRQGIAYRSESEVIQLNHGVGMSLNTLVFPYTLDFDGLDNRILYYETSRGCPFNCQYCLSSIEKGVRFKSLNKVVEELGFFLAKKVRQVKFVDRTFNAKQEHAIGIMEYIIAHDNGITNFHFEVAPELLNDAFFEVLKQARKGLFQLEMGVQSTHATTLNIIKRHNQLDKISDVTQRIKALGNTHIHMDLIAGLPEESFARFSTSFNFVYQLQPDQLQLGFLKVLKGSGMMNMADEYSILYRDYPPYEVLQTHVLSYQELESLKLIEEMVELFYNSGQYVHFIQLFMKCFLSPFDGFHWLSKQWKKKGMHHQKHQRLDLCQFLYECIHSMLVKSMTGSDEYVELARQQDKQILQMAMIEALTYDYCLKEKPKKELPWMELSSLEPKIQNLLLAILEKGGTWIEENNNYTQKQLSRMYHMSKLERQNMQYIQHNQINQITQSTQSTQFNQITQITPNGKIQVSLKEFYEETPPMQQQNIYGTYRVINYEHRDFLHNNGEAMLIEITP